MTSSIDRSEVEKALANVMDPEIGISIMEMNLVEQIDIDDGNISVYFRLTAPFCPPVFAMKIAKDIKETLRRLEGVKSVKVVLRNHYMAEQINKIINEL
ncbi:MAG: iron-sulfur cluster assembly protein [Nitrososphaerota archaeon]|nr:iron-sulfur cluster assembly protein [Nitrososphaerales archaeon]MDW8044231.1 iron-sulfur cluster assembly protein [Nitrososphaerota archaeon]